MNDLKTLIARVEAASGPDREIDAALYNLLHTDNFRPVAFNAFSQADPEYFDLSRYHDGWLIGKTNRDVYAEDLEHYTESLDAALSLVEAKLPGWGWCNEKSCAGLCRAVVWHPMAKLHDWRACGSNPALALCNALLRALAGDAP